MAFTGDADRRRHGRRLGPDQPGRARRRARRRRRRPDAPGDPRLGARRRRSASAAFYAQVDLDQAKAYEYAIQVMAAAATDRRRPGGHRRLPREAQARLLTDPSVSAVARALASGTLARPALRMRPTTRLASGQAARAMRRRRAVARSRWLRIVRGGDRRARRRRWPGSRRARGRGRGRGRGSARRRRGRRRAAAASSSHGLITVVARASRRASAGRPTPRSPTAAGRAR